MENFYEFTAYNSQTRYGYGTEAQAEGFCAILNQGREINLYAPRLLDQLEVDGPLAGFEGRDDVETLGDVLDSSLDDIAHNIREARDLSELYAAINEFDRICHAAERSVTGEHQSRGVDMCALPTFGGAEPDRTAGVWSWDATHLLVGEGALDIVSREEWADAVDRYQRGAA